MKATAAISIAALVAALAATPALALDLNVGLGANVGVNVSGSDDSSIDASAGGSADGGVSVGTDDGDLGVDTNVTGAIGATASAGDEDIGVQLDGLLQLINDADYDEGSFSTWADASATSVVKVDDLFDLDAQSQIDAAVQANLDEHEDLSAAINANANLKAWLDANDIDANSVIAIGVSADGSVEVYEG
jgi:hypothetical protein